MGKKAVVMNKASSTICKSEKQQQFNSLIKVLKPKVYITDPSNFKTLVQELTGNGSSLLPPPAVPYSNQNEVLDIKAEDYLQHENATADHEQEFVSLDACFDSFDLHDYCSWNQVAANEETNETWDTTYEDVAAAFGYSSTSSVSHYQQSTMDLLAVRELESWLLDLDDHHHPSSFNYQWSS